MKKIALFLLLLCVAVSVIFACENETTSPTETTEAVTTDTTEAVTTDVTTALETEAPIILEDEGGNILTDTELHGWFDYGTALYLRDDFKVGSRNDISFSMMKNELEGFQYILASCVNYSDLRCEVSTLTDGNGNTLEGTVYIAQNVNIRKADDIHPRGFTPDALLAQDNPYHGGTFDLSAGCSQTLYVQYKTDANTIPGIYTGRLEIKQGDTVLLAGEVSVKIFNIYYDEKTECLSYFQYEHAAWDEMLKGAPNLDLHDGLNEAYADFLVANRMSLFSIPFDGDLADPRSAKYMDNPRVNFVLLQDFNKYGAVTLTEQYRIATENNWLDKIGFLSFDEPTNEAQFRKLLTGVQLINAHFPTTNHVNAFGHRLSQDGRNLVERFSDFSTMHCINVYPMYEIPEHYDTMLRLKEERGDTLFWYVCGSQKDNYINLLPCTPGTSKRILFWQQYQHNIDGFHYWHTTYWKFYANVWDENYENIKPKPVSSLDAPTGDGCLVYWDPITYEPIGSLGLEAVRDGIEDFQLMRMAEKVLGKETVMNYTKRLTTSATEYTTDSDLLEQVKTELATALEVASAQ